MRGETDSVLGPPPDVGGRHQPYDPNWYEKIERAMQARELGEQLQKDVRMRYNTHDRDKRLGLRDMGPFLRGVPFKPL